MSRNSFRLGVEALEARRLLAVPVAVADGIVPGAAVSVPLVEATAQFSQPAGFSVSNILDGNDGTGWANSALANNVAVFETTTNVGGGGSTLLTFTFRSGGFSQHTLGKFRFSVTNDDRGAFADGAQNGGDVTANWIPVTPVAIRSDNAGTTFTINPDGSILAGGGVAEHEVYTLQATTTVGSITGVRLEALEDPSLPANGPGRAANGNYVVYNLSMTAQAGAVVLQNATSQFTQAGFNVAALIDGVSNPGLNSLSSWANHIGSTPSNAAAFESLATLNPSGENMLLTFTVVSGYFGTHEIGNLRFSVTSDNRAQFADGLNGGDVTANWVQLTPLAASSTGPSTVATLLADNSILFTGAPVNNGLETYTIHAITNVANITGFRLEALENPALPDNGPGRAANGNFVMYEVGVSAQTGFLTASEDGSTTLDVLANDLDLDGDALTIAGVTTIGTQGTIFNSGNNLTYTPSPALQALAAGQIFIDRFSYTVRDPSNQASSTSALVIVQGANDAPLAVSDTLGLATVPLQNPTAIFSQAGFSLPALIDGDENPPANSASAWANAVGAGANDSGPNTAVFETATNLNPGGLPGELIFRITSGDFATHEIGRFRLSVTTDDRSQFADGLHNGGDVTANWTVLIPSSVTTTGTSTFSVLGDASVLAGGTPQERETYILRVPTNLANITGFRLEAIEDAALPPAAAGANGGPGRGGVNGNYVMQEFGVSFLSALTTLADTPISATGLLVNDSDIDSPLTVFPAGARTSALGASVTVNADGAFTYDPTSAPGVLALDQGEVAVDTFTYTLSDGSATSSAATVSISVTGLNETPTASSGGPYTIAETQGLQLNAAIVDLDAGANLLIDWDLDGDGQFDDATGANPLVPWSTLTSMTNPVTDQLVNRPITVRVRDGIAAAVTSSTTLTVTNAAPSIEIDAPLVGVIGQPLEFIFDIIDSPADLAAGFEVEIDWDGDGDIDETINDASSPLVLTHVFETIGAPNVSITARDKDNATTTPEATHAIDISNFVEDNGVLLIGGSGGADRIIVQPGRGGIQVRFNNRILGNFANSSEGMIFGGGGNDNITVASRLGVAFTIDGGEGNDYIAGGRLGDTLIGGSGRDRLLGSGGADIILGGDGNDTLSGGLGNDFLDGEAGNDQAKGDGGHDTVLGGEGNDRVFGDTGNDLVRGGEGGDIVDGGAGNDVQSGDGASDRLYGRAGNDVLVGGEFVDYLYGGAGDDLMLGSFLFDDSDFGLLDLLASWTSGGSVQDRIDLLLPTIGADEDSAGDTLNGEGGGDWFLLFLNDRHHATDRSAPNVHSRLGMP